MTKKTTKKALIASLLSLLLCFSMLIGTTFAWFTDSVTSSGNIIQSGTLDVEMYWAEGGKAVPADGSADWNNAAEGPMFTYKNWEPGYVEAKHILIKNVGSLALNYELRITTSDVLSELADVIDVYYFENATELNRANLANGTKLGTLTEIMGTALNISNTVNGSLDSKATRTLSLAFKMQESAGNEYQNLTIGDFAVQLVATQKSQELDSFGPDYDKDALSAKVPAARVIKINPDKTVTFVKDDSTEITVVEEDLKIMATAGIGGAAQEMYMDTLYKFEPTQTYDDMMKSEYKYYIADFVVSADRDVPANSLALAGYYNAWCEYNNNNWVALSSPDEIAAGTEIRLVQSMGAAVHYKDICEYGNDGLGFMCGAVDLTGANAGTTLTVKLCLFETEADPNGSSASSTIVPGSEPIVIGVFEYTFGGTYNTHADGSVTFEEPDGKSTLVSVVDVADSDYAVPAGVTNLGSGVFAQNSNITTVTIPASVTDFGATGVSATGASSGAFKGSAVTTVVIEDGATEIPAAAFNGAKNITSVTIPDSVTTIGVNAFRQTAITELVIPATITNINYGAFRDMTSLTTVTFEGNHVDIPNYAFRGCTNLRTVNIKNADTATIGTNMAFANASSNNPGTNNITFYVKNAEVADLIKTSMGVGSYVAIYVGDTLYAEIV